MATSGLTSLLVFFVGLGLAAELAKRMGPQS